MDVGNPGVDCVTPNSVAAKSPIHSLSRDRAKGNRLLPGKFFDLDQQFVCFLDLAALLLKREISPLDTPKEKRKA
jgi:hypothetical protein